MHSNISISVGFQSLSIFISIFSMNSFPAVILVERECFILFLEGPEVKANGL
jgi:hypothetical protein